MAKPIGPICNLACEYCFYLKKEGFYPAGERWRMTDETLEAYIRQYIEAQPPEAEEIAFAFQGGEPTLMGLDYFRRAVELQKQYTPPGKRVHNALQTNGLLLSDEWCEFLKTHKFLVGLSIDGPAEFHDKYRRDKGGGGTHDRVLRVLQRLQRHGVDFNALVCVNRYNGDHPLRVYRFLREQGVEYMQFIPIVERLEGVVLQGDPGDRPPERLVSPRSVLPAQYGRFLIGVFDEWVRHDVGRRFVLDFEQAVGAWSGVGTTLCIYSRALRPGHRAGAQRRSVQLRPLCRAGLPAGQHQPDADQGVGQLGPARAVRFRQGADPARLLPPLLGAFHLSRGLSQGAFPPLARRPTGAELPVRRLQGVFPVHRSLYASLGRRVPRRPVGGGCDATLAGPGAAHRDEALAAGQPLRRNDPCPCGSGRKFKSCCLKRPGVLD